MKTTWNLGRPGKFLIVPSLAPKRTEKEKFYKSMKHSLRRNNVKQRIRNDTHISKNQKILLAPPSSKRH